MSVTIFIIFTTHNIFNLIVNIQQTGPNLHFWDKITEISLKKLIDFIFNEINFDYANIYIYKIFAFCYF